MKTMQFTQSECETIRRALGTTYNAEAKRMARLRKSKSANRPGVLSGQACWMADIKMLFDRFCGELERWSQGA